MYTKERLERNLNYVMAYIYGDDWKEKPVKQTWEIPSINLDESPNESSNEILWSIIDIVSKNLQKFYSNKMLVYLINKNGVWNLRQTTKVNKSINNGIVFRASKSLFELIRYKFNNNTSFELTQQQVEGFIELSLLFDDMYKIEQRNQQHSVEYINWILYGEGWKEHLKEESIEHIAEIISHITQGD